MQGERRACRIDRIPLTWEHPILQAEKDRLDLDSGPAMCRAFRRLRGWEMHIPVRYLRRFHAVMTLTWLALLAPTLLWWHSSILWVAVMSVYANVAASFSAWQGARAEDAAGS